MVRRLPPLNALRGFESAARHLSFTRAADELNVTQAAISHQVKGLEEWLGKPLFRRAGRRLRLTEAGQLYLPPVRDALDGLATATKRLLDDEDDSVLTITTMDSFAATWLMPRLARFRELQPDIDVRLSANDDLVDLSRGDVDMAIRYGQGNWPGCEAELIVTEELFPVCSPDLLERGPPLVTPQDLAKHTLLHDDMVIDWAYWLEAAGVTGVDARRGPYFQHSYLTIDAAVRGEGVAIGRSVLVSDALITGKLVRPFDLALPAVSAYYAAWPKGGGESRKVKAFRDWLLAEAAPDIET